MHFEKALEATRNDYISHIENNPFFEKLRSGSFTRLQYIAYIRETYHLIHHTVPYLELAAEKISGKDNWLHSFFSEFAHQEKGHDLLCVNDIRALGEDPTEVLSGHPSQGGWAMITQNYYLATVGNPVALIGDAVATEGLGETWAKAVADLLETKCGIPRNATTFLRVHGLDDIAHADEAREALERYGHNDTYYDDIVHAWKMTLQYYGQLFTDSLALGDLWATNRQDHSAKHELVS
ncbi:iron-containing redox enzyme family protein [Plectonema radiosum NIES-515]|uniref:Iron-containing redox enzyme family protein n=1 Tax=Plectonema radiosum NIES-515 TaxID=2986073 RepID=A0ABT3B5R6_9CYAN|nr:iron-containing redox enzyme family protein [Plectonema radiosum]MCV3216580.1 iron-containing redox enzyme family protein [Plectonema radiosum NIES-515]